MQQITSGWDIFNFEMDVNTMTKIQALHSNQIIGLYELSKGLYKQE